MQKYMFQGVAVAVFAAISMSAAASPVGVWKTIDDQTGKARSHIQIWEHKGVLYGKVTKLLDSKEPNPLCDKCTGKRKGKPVLGMTIVWGLKKTGDGEWSEGHVFDPESGKTYQCKATLKNREQSLEFRGFLGISLLGRTQVWQRVK